MNTQNLETRRQFQMSLYVLTVILLSVTAQETSSAAGLNQTFPPDSSFKTSINFNALPNDRGGTVGNSPYEVLRNLYETKTTPTRLGEIPTQGECYASQKRMKTLRDDVIPSTKANDVQVLDGYFTNDTAKFIYRFEIPAVAAKGPLFPAQAAVPEKSLAIQNFFTVNDCTKPAQSSYNALAINRDHEFIFFKGKQYLNYNTGFSFDFDKYEVAETLEGLLVRWTFVNLDESFLDQLVFHFRTLNKDTILIKIEQRSKPGHSSYNYLWRS